MGFVQSLLVHSYTHTFNSTFKNFCVVCNLMTVNPDTATT